MQTRNGSVQLVRLIETALAATFIHMILADHPRISIDPQVCGGRPVIAGTRMRVSDVLGMLASGAELSEITEDFPYIAADDVRAALLYAATISDHPVVLAAE